VTPESLANRLHDINELDTVSVWPLAPGWWLLLAAVGAVMLLMIALRRWHPDWRRYLPRHGWSLHAANELRALRQRVGLDDSRTLSAELSELLRRIAIARCGRRRCAGLHGTAWLAWLSEHDPDGFNWRDHGQLLLDLPYAPPGETAEDTRLQLLIDAALAWTSQPRNCAHSAETLHGV
jgi:hypothetical protein